ncbi:MAG: serine protease Do [Chthoniobacter sp.]|jgi:serine protease Do|nr:serine protease Do [Chthoniobacter sp.]
MSPHRVSKTALALFFLCAAARAESDSDALTRQVRALFDRCQKAVVKVEATDEHGQISGSGFFVDPNGTLYTSYSVGGQSRDIVVSHGDTKYPATRLVADPRSGIAILKVDAQTPFLPAGKSKELSEASMVMTIGYPMDMAITPNFGCVGGWNMKYLGRYFFTAHIRANVPVQRGEGGAPLLNMNGEAVGVLISSLENNAGCFALPIEAAEKVRADFMRFGQVRPGWLGIKFVETTQSTADSNVQVDDFADNAPAEKSGVERGDILLRVGESKIEKVDDVLNAAFYLTAGDEVPVTVSRHGEKLDLKVTLTLHPAMATMPVASGAPLPPPR